MMTIEFYRLLHKNSSIDVKVHFWHFGRKKRSPRAKVMNWHWLISFSDFFFLFSFIFFEIFLVFWFFISSLSFNFIKYFFFKFWTLIFFFKYFPNFILCIYQSFVLDFTWEINFCLLSRKPLTNLLKMRKKCRHIEPKGGATWKICQAKRHLCLHIQEKDVKREKWKWLWRIYMLLNNPNKKDEF